MLTFTGHTGVVQGVAFSPDGKQVLTSSSDETARLWDVRQREEVLKFTGHTGSLRGAAFSPDGKTVLTGGDDNTARLWDAQTGLELKRFIGHTGAGCAASPFARRQAGPHRRLRWHRQIVGCRHR